MDVLKGTVIFIAGLAVGAGAGYIFCKKKYEKESEEEIENIKQYYKDRFEKDLEKSEEINEKLTVITDEAFNTEKKQEVVDYTDISKKDKEEKEIVNAEKESPEEDEPTKPYLITEEEYLEGNNNYEKLSLTYFAMDDTLADDCDEMVDVEETISSDIYNQIAESDEDLYVRNPILECDYEIMKVEGSFKERYGY